jgi:hypothetical protein
MQLNIHYEFKLETGQPTQLQKVTERHKQPHIVKTTTFMICFSQCQRPAKTLAK